MPSRTARRWGVQLEDIDLRNQLETLIGSNQKELAEKKKKKTAETHEEDNREEYSFSANVGGEEARSSLSYEYSVSSWKTKKKYRFPFISLIFFWGLIV